MHHKKTSCLIKSLLIFAALSCADSNHRMEGRWKFIPAEGTDVVTWRYNQQELEIARHGKEIAILQNYIYRNKVAYIDSMIFVPGGGPRTSTQTTPNWSGNWYMGVLTKIGSEKIVTGHWLEADSGLQVEREETLQTSQGEIQVRTTREYRVEGDKLVVMETRSTRPTPIKLVFERQSQE